MKAFIDESIHNGILNYQKSLEKQNINRVHIFEYEVIKTLINIFNQDKIISPFKANNEEDFRKNLLMFGLKETERDQFVKLMNDYHKWLNSPYLVAKTDLPTKIEALLIQMIVLKGSKQKIQLEEIEQYDNFFDPIEGDFAKYKDLVVTDKTITPNLWRTKKRYLENQELTKEEINLLPASDYKRYGLNIDEVKGLPIEKIREINTRIEDEEATANAGGDTKFDPKKLILTSGSGFVDTIVLFSIIATQILIGLLIAFAFMRG